MPLISKEDNASREVLVHYFLGAGPSPRQEYEVDQHLLARPPHAWDMTKYLNPTFVRAKDVKSVLHQRLPSVDKLFNLRHSSQGWYQYQLDDIRLTTTSANQGKFSFITPDIADLVEYGMFIHQTASCVIGDDNATQKLLLIDDLIHEAYISGNRVQTWQGRPTDSPNKVEKHCTDVLKETLMQQHPPLAAPAVHADEKGRRKSRKGKEKADGDLVTDIATGSRNDDDGSMDNSKDIVDRIDVDVIADRLEEDRDWTLADATGSAPTGSSVPSGLLNKLRAFAKDLELQYRASLPRVHNVPEPFGLDLDGATQKDVLIAVLKEATRFEVQRRESCNAKRVYRPDANACQPEFKVSDPLLKGLSRFSAANSSPFTMLLVSKQPYLEARLKRCHGTGLELPSQAAYPGHPLSYSYGHAIHGALMNHGFSQPWPVSLTSRSTKTLAQDFVLESRWFDYWRGSQRRIISSLDLNKHFGVGFSSHLQDHAFVNVDVERARKLKSLSLRQKDLAKIEPLNMSWRSDMDQCIHINVYNPTEQALFRHLTQ